MKTDLQLQTTPTFLPTNQPTDRPATHPTIQGEGEGG